MASRWLTRVAVATAVAGIVTITGAKAVWADDPAGNNGTVKIESTDVDSNDNSDISHDPHVTCKFQVKFFNFDEGQTATMTFTIQPPSGDNGDVLKEKEAVVSDDAAGGGTDDDAVFDFDGADFGLGAFTLQPQQGYHVKLNVVSEGLPGGQKHKVFWLECFPASPSPSPSESPSVSPSSSQPPATSAPPTTTTPGLPVTGAGLTGIIAAGLALVGTGVALLMARRRRAATEGPAEL
jgi:hypothetical protein